MARGAWLAEVPLEAVVVVPADDCVLECGGRCEPGAEGAIDVIRGGSTSLGGDWWKEERSPSRDGGAACLEEEDTCL